MEWKYERLKKETEINKRISNLGRVDIEKNNKEFRSLKQNKEMMNIIKIGRARLDDMR